jgi:glycosyltransferase involved in cell wall biosynthesis
MMRIVLFCHPDFLPSQSMPRFANMLESAYRARGIEVHKWTPRAIFRYWIQDVMAGRWLGYIDQYVLFPLWVRRQLKHTPADTLFVFCDQALGPWVPLVAHRPHVVHAHDLLALRSALGDIRENPTSLTGRIYQRFIRRGARRSRHFISISRKTRDDLHRFMDVNPAVSEVVYNGLNYPYSRLPADVAQQTLTAAGLPVEPRGMLLHVGGGQWYKNLPGVIALYARYAASHSEPLPLWCIGPPPGGKVADALRALAPAGRVLFFQDIASSTLQAAYSHARALLFPSLEEGFGWPLIEAAACGCPVLTTDRPPMSEIAGPGAVCVPRLRPDQDLQSWAMEAAGMLDLLLRRPEAERNADAQQMAQWVERFDSIRTIDQYLEIYRRIVAAYPAAATADLGVPRGAAS